MSSREEREAANRKYLKEKVDVHLNKLIVDILKNKPSDVLQFISNWVSEQSNKGEPTKQDNPVDNQVAQEIQEIAEEKTINMADCKRDADENYEAPDINSDDEDDEGDDVPDLDTLRKQSKKIGGGQRISVSAEVYGLNNEKGNYVPTVVPKSDEAKERISKRLSQAFMFASLDEKEKNIVLNAMSEHNFKKDDVVIKQGDDGDVLYCVDSGKLNCFRKFNKEDEEPGKFLKSYEPGESFGELALLYNAPRAATIIADDDAVCFSLDRDCFNNIVKEATIKRRERFEEFVNKVELLQELDAYERGQLADCLNTENYNEGDYIIKQGDQGDRFYLIEEGTAIAEKQVDGGEAEKVLDYKENDYFGELALLKDDVRAASIKCTSAVRVAWIERTAFKRLLGSLEEILKKNSAKYEKYLSSE